MHNNWDDDEADDDDYVRDDNDCDNFFSEATSYGRTHLYMNIL